MPAQGDLVGHGSIRLLPIANIRRDGLTQHRSSLDAEIVAEYAALMSEGVAFPPVRVWWDGGVLLAFGRLQAHRRGGGREPLGAVG